jgi:hypothetical protein
MRIASLPHLTRLAALVSVSAFFGPPHIAVKHVATPATAPNGVVFELEVKHHTHAGGPQRHRVAPKEFATDVA